VLHTNLLGPESSPTYARSRLDGSKLYYIKLELRVVIEADLTRANSEKFEPDPSYR
jgi:hypothetical protein